MFPDAEDAPAFFAEGVGYAPVAFSVGGELLFPEGAVAGGLVAVAGTVVPEAAIDEEGDAVGAEDEVGLAEDGDMATPAGDAVAAEEGCASIGFA